MAACFSDNQPMDLEKLLLAGANPNAQNIHSNTALMSGYQKVLLTRSNRHQHKVSRRHRSFHAGNDKAVEVLLNATADINIQDQEGTFMLTVGQ